MLTCKQNKNCINKDAKMKNVLNTHNLATIKNLQRSISTRVFENTDKKNWVRSPGNSKSIPFDEQQCYS